MLVTKLDKRRVAPLVDMLIEVSKKCPTINTKYTEIGHYHWIIHSYWKVFNLCEQKGYKRVLDFGCGTGISQLVYDTFGFDFDLVLADLDKDWAREKSIFDYFVNSMGFVKYDFTDILCDDFRFLDPLPIKFDVVITTRFVPLSHLHVTPSTFKQLLGPYCDPTFDLLYSNVTQIGSNNSAANIDIRLYHVDAKEVFDDGELVKVMIW